MNRLLSVSLTLALLAGCANDPIYTARAKLDANNSFIADAGARGVPRAPQTGRITQSPEIYLGEEVIDLGRGQALPETSGSIDLTLREALPLSSIARALSEQTGYPIVSLLDDAPRVFGRLRGDLPTVLANLKSDYQIGYEHRDGTIMLVPAGVEIVPIPTVILPQLPAGSLANSGRSRSGGGGGNQQAQTTRGEDSLTSSAGLEKFLTELPTLAANSPYAGPQTSITVNKRLSVIALKAPPAALPGLKRMVEDRLAQILTPTRVTLYILTLDVGDSRTFSSNLDYVWGSLLGQPARFAGNSSAAAISLLRNTPTNIKADTLDASIQSVASRLNVLNNQRFTVILAPGYVMPISDKRIITYVRESTPPGQSSSSSISSTTATVSQDEVEVGTDGSITAAPTSKSSVRVAYNFSLAQLLDFRTVTSGNVTLQQPDTAPRQFANIVDLKSGEMILADSRLVETVRRSSSGAVSPDIPVPGSLGSETRMQLILVMLSAELVPPTAPQRYPGTDNVLRVAGGL